MASASGEGKNLARVSVEPPSVADEDVVGVEPGVFFLDVLLHEVVGELDPVDSGTAFAVGFFQMHYSEETGARQLQVVAVGQAEENVADADRLVVGVAAAQASAVFRTAVYDPGFAAVGFGTDNPDVCVLPDGDASGADVVVGEPNERVARRGLSDGRGRPVVVFCENGRRWRFPLQ